MSAMPRQPQARSAENAPEHSAAAGPVPPPRARTSSGPPPGPPPPAESRLAQRILVTVPVVVLTYPAGLKLRPLTADVDVPPSLKLNTPWVPGFYRL